MNRFQKFLQESGIAKGHRHSPAERASYFLWYHLRATGERDADLEVIEKYLVESDTTCPDLQGLYKQLLEDGNGMVVCVKIPGRLSMKPEWSTIMEKDYGDKVFQGRGLAPLWFWRAPDGSLVRIGSKTDLVKYWPQRSWLAAWLMVSLGIFGILVPIFSGFPSMRWPPTSPLSAPSPLGPSGPRR